ncbi:MAG: phosphate-starvation-inducible PsiE family protein [Gammaproteobacteria bacterium]|nr:phosphate-starvation-inducible PsiE family protein [Gammaproteobacteria bacterium]
MAEQKFKQRVQAIGDHMVDAFHYLALFIIGATIVWSAIVEYVFIMQKGHAALKDILLLFIYLELGAMVGIYFKTHRLPVQFLIYIAITALSRHLVIDVQQVSESFHLYLLLSITGAIAILGLAVLILTYTGHRFGRPEDEVVQADSGRDATVRTPDAEK